MLDRTGTNVRFHAHAGGVTTSNSGYPRSLTAPAVSVARDAEGCYFKAGAYTQSNLEQGDEPDAYGEVVITELVVTHE